ncbi:MAG: glycosyltransferase family 1 protein [Candidatus Aegiribacteria sp.]
MRIGLEVSPLAINRTGIPNYIRRLLTGFASIPGDNTYFLYTNRPLPEDLRLPDNFRTVLLRRPLPRFQLWFQLALPGRLKKDRVDIFHGLFSRLPLRLPVPGALTVYDLSGYNMPRLHKRWTHMTNLMYPAYVRKAEGIVAISRATAREIEKYFPRASSKVTVIPAAAPPEYAEVKDRDRLRRTREKLGLPERFILYLGTIEPRKNLTRLLEAYMIAAGSIPHSLVISGSVGWKTGEMFRELKSSGVRDRVKLTGFVDSEDIPALMTLADLFVFPSLYEGFGLPILEAMSCGTPVVTSNVSSMQEVAGDAALLVDPLSSDSIAEGLKELALDRKRREELRVKGLRRSAEFRWTDIAERTLQFYSGILSRGDG